LADLTEIHHSPLCVQFLVPGDPKTCKEKGKKTVHKGAPVAALNYLISEKLIGIFKKFISSSPINYSKNYYPSSSYQ
jgi:hypothetical protein